MSNTLFNLVKENVYKEKEIQAVSLNSQDKVTNWIFDFKSQGLSKVFLQEFAKYFWEEFQNKYGAHIQIGGMETGAIPLIAGVSLFAPEKVKATSFYIRKSRKKSDLANLVEGDIAEDVPIVLIDDIINNGKTTRKQIKILEDMGHKVSAVFTCLRFRDISQYKDLTDKGIEIISIFELNDFSKDLPVKNLDPNVQDSFVEKYSGVYKISLTKKPNLYFVVPKSGPILVEEFIYMGADDGSFFCLRASDGSVVWTYKVLFGSGGKRIFSSSVVYKDRVLFGAYDGNLYCLNRFTGKREWVFTDADWVGSSPCVDESRGIVFVGLEFGLFKKQGGIVAVDIHTGEALWKNYTMTGLTHASPAYNKKFNVVVCGCNDNFMYAFNAKTGEVVWKFETQREVQYGAVFDHKRDLVVFGSMDGGLYLLNIKDGQLYHKFEARFGFYSTPSIEGDIVVIGSLDKIVYSFNIASRKVVWTFETSGRIFASPLIDRGSVFIGNNGGVLHEMDLLTGKLLSLIQLTERIVNRIQIEHTRDGKRVLYIPTHVCELYKMVEK